MITLEVLLALIAFTFGSTALTFLILAAVTLRTPAKAIFETEAERDARLARERKDALDRFNAAEARRAAKIDRPNWRLVWLLVALAIVALLAACHSPTAPKDSTATVKRTRGIDTLYTCPDTTASHSSTCGR
jgi:hypothetical protein